MTSQEHIWRTLRNKIEEDTCSKISMEFYSGGFRETYQWFCDIEQAAFRSELRYTPDELERRTEQEGLLFFFIFVDGSPFAVVLGYTSYDLEDAFYLDTIAVRVTGEGIGKTIMWSLVNWAKSKGYKQILLDTEEVNERGIPLKRFYERLGFKVLERMEDGNLRMVRVL